MSPEVDVQGWTAGNRRLIAEVLNQLDESRWEAPTLCRGWTVRHTAAHLLQPVLVGFRQFFMTSVRYRGDTDRTVDHITRRLAHLQPDEITALLRAHAHDRVSPRRVGPWGPFAETCIHLRDIARPLGLDADVPRPHWTALLDYLTSGHVAPALVPEGRLLGLRLTAVDAARDLGEGPQVRGSLEALALALTGRVAALEDLEGPGVDVLRSRIERADPVG